MSIKNKIQNIKRNSLNNNTQRVAHTLLSAEGKWVSRTKLDVIPSVTARIRDLRKDQFGGFDVECKSSTELKPKSKEQRTHYYRINPDSVTDAKIQVLFRSVTAKAAAPKKTAAKRAVSAKSAAPARKVSAKKTTTRVVASKPARSAKQARRPVTVTTDGLVTTKS